MLPMDWELFMRVHTEVKWDEVKDIVAHIKDIVDTMDYSTATKLAALYFAASSSGHQFVNFMEEGERLRKATMADMSEPEGNA